MSIQLNIIVKSKRESRQGNTLNELYFLVIPILVMFIGCQSSDISPQQHTTWKDYGGGPDQSKYVEMDQITKQNIKNLEEYWFYPTGDKNIYQFNPLIVDSLMFVLAKNNSIVALNVETGEEVWIHANLSGIARRGLNYWESEDKKDKRIIFQMNNYLQAIDAESGKSITSFGSGGLVDLREGLGREPSSIVRVQSGTPGKIFENLLILGSSTGESYMSSPGHLRAFDVISGELVWTFHTIPHPGEYGYDTWPEDAYKYIGGVNVWGEIAVDANRGIAYFPLGSPTYDYYGADRKGSNLFGNCILALDARTGERIWHYQTVHHDIWDYDLTSAPQLLTVNHKGKVVDIVAVATKHSFVFVFDRVTGEPIWPIEEREVPQSQVPGEEAWPTQPFPTLPPPISRQSITSKDVSSIFLNEEEQMYWRRKIDSAQTGLFTPLSRKQETISMPGAVGGVNWGNTASDPKNGILYVINIDYPSFYGKLQTLSEIQSTGEQQLGSGQSAVYVKNCQACHGIDMGGMSGPSLINLGARLALPDFKQLMRSGRGDMPAFSDFEESEIESLYTFLQRNSPRINPRIGESDTSIDPPKGPVVAVGGIPGGQDPREITGSPGRYGAPYPKDVNIPYERLYLQGWGLGLAHVINPPWSEIVAYDLNKGDIKWRRPLGQDLEALERGAEGTGMLSAQRNSMIVTSTGIVFSTAKDGNVYAFDADNGEELWRAKLPMASEGLMAMYEYNGKQYLAVPATTPLKFGRSDGENPSPPQPTGLGGYVVFALKD